MATQELLVRGATGLLVNLSSVVSQQITEAWSVKDELKKLKRTLEKIAAITTDAENKQGEYEVVRLWLKRLKDVVYDADDVLDEFSYEAMRQVEMGGKRNKVRNFFSSSNSLVLRCNMAQKIKNIKKRLDDMFIEISRFQFQVSTGGNTYDHNIVQQNRLILSAVDESSVLGRDNDKSTIINMLTTPHPSSSSLNPTQQENISFISIVGVGGLGKSTLAQLIYDDELIIRNFETRAWVCVSDDFDIIKILTNIIESVTNIKCDHFSSFIVLADKFQKELSNKKYFLVLDDIWNEDPVDWDELRCLLAVGAHGSKVLVTTRSDKVASIVGGPIAPYMLGNLPQSACWSIIKNKAFCLGGEIVTPKMICIGEEIATKCGGLPLAAKVLGNVMRLHKTETDWLSIVNHAIFNMVDVKTKMVAILKLSYDKLPSRAKLCFSYCSLFPKDWEINREILIRLWIAEGFIHPSHEGNQKSLEDVGDDYFHSLLANSFFQGVTRDKLGDIKTCKMHDLVHDLAQSVNGVHDIKIVNSGKMESVSKFRCLQIVLDKQNSKTFSKILEKAKRLRSIFSIENDHLGEHLLYGKNLRVVCLLRRHALEIQSSIFKLKHLRYLDLSYCSFNEGRDVSISQLYNLRTLVLHKCENVTMILVEIGSLKMLSHLNLSFSDVEYLPDSVVQLTNLQTLDLYRCTRLVALPVNIGSLKDLNQLKLKYCETLKVLPSEVGALTRLRCLDLSFTMIKVLHEPGISNLCNLESIHFGKCELPKEIRNLPKLRIFKHWRDNEDEMPRGIQTLTCLEVLESYVVRNTETTSYSCGDGGIIKELASLNNLQKLKISYLEFVRGGMDAERALLKDKINLHDLCLKWGSIFYEDEEIVFDEELESLEPNEVLEGLEPNHSLRDLRLFGFPGSKLPKWMGSSICLPNLVEIKLWYCNKCEKLPALGLLPCLKVLEIEVMRSVKCLGEEFYYQQHEEGRISNSGRNGIGSCSAASPTTGSLFPSLIVLQICQMENLEEWVAPPLQIYNSFPFLEKLEIKRCPKLRSTPNSFPFLKKLVLCDTNSKEVASILSTGGLTYLTSIDISYSPELRYLPQGVLLQNITPNLEELSIDGCPKFQGFLQDNDLNNYNNGRQGDRDFETILSFSCPEINYSNSNKSLRSIYFNDCPVLTLLPDIRSFTSLQKLAILKCDKLKESISYDLKTLTFLKELKFDFIQSEYTD
ncbi:putative disease resistance RPP13-like protein 1 [Papaver somniferum]|uniref:putative disease resistance RPP13-like protein 1 n=1 Tax=Papaver somniferum TaxID=3469 RepID=UPI000E6FC594|nr:putative disease resistance RPP13-like protein 1 [Papaver somniferum]XP_026437134.1 putative disease resistance RPP13-like protein 1 [Papaver somniferum]